MPLISVFREEPGRNIVRRRLKVVNADNGTSPGLWYDFASSLHNTN